MSESGSGTKGWWYAALASVGFVWAFGSWIHVGNDRLDDGKVRRAWKKATLSLLSRQESALDSEPMGIIRTPSNERQRLEATIDACDSIRASLARWREKGNVSNALRKKRRGRPLYISAPINALVEGVVTDSTTFSDLLQHGNFGLGTFNQLDGEAVVLDGKVYRLRDDGTTEVVDPHTKTPFVCLTDFDPSMVQETIFEETFVGWSVLKSAIESLFESKNVVYSIRIDAMFSYIKTRAVSKAQGEERLVDAAQRQKVFEFENVEGSMVGFYTPTFLSTVHVPGFHLHFIDKDRKIGGHLLDVRVHGLKVQIQESHAIVLQLPITDEYMKRNLSTDVQEELMRAES